MLLQTRIEVVSTKLLLHTNWKLSIKIVEVVQGAWLAKSFASPCALAVLQSKPATEEQT